MIYYLKHHGIKGQRWGKKNGPPYPLDAGDHSVAEKKHMRSYSAPVSKNKLKRALYNAKQKHYSRNELQIDLLPDTVEKAIQDGWIELSEKMSALHQNFTEDGVKNSKWISPDGHKEVVFTGINKRITSHVEDEGTYNFYSPKTNKIGHLMADVLPYYMWGNSPEDTTRIRDRVDQTIKNCLNVKMKSIKKG